MAMLAPLRIRQATDADAPALLAIYAPQSPVISRQSKELAAVG